MSRLVGLLAFAGGLALAQTLEAPPGWIVCLPALLAITALLRGPHRPRRGPGIAIALAGIAAAALVLGVGSGDSRLAAIDAGAMDAGAGRQLLVRGHVTASAWRERGEVRVPLATPRGRVMVLAEDAALPRSPPIGRLLQARGTLVKPPASDEFMRSRLRRIGISHELRAIEVEVLPERRGGPAGVLDAMRANAERAVGAGLDSRQAGLARGFVLGGDDRIDPAIEEDFRRTGLSHLLAVSGQNVLLLAALAGVALGLLGLGLRARLAVSVLLIALYVPITGAGASIQRAAVMGAAGLLMTILGRPADRGFVLALALVATLLVNPRFTGDVGWQLSFAAVVGIGLWAARLSRLLASHRPLSALPERVGGPAAEAIALTIAATLATAPLIAFTFERLSLASLLANVAVAPAVAPVMWLGMASSFIGQFVAWPLVPGLLEVVGAASARLIDYVAGIAHGLSGNAWAELEVEPPSVAALAATYACLAAGVGAILAIVERRGGLRVRRSRLLAAVAATTVLWAAASTVRGGDASLPPLEGIGTRVTVLDVGQGDATLLQPSEGLPILVDSGPAEADVAEQLEDLGIERLGALLITHDQSDHAGGAPEILSRLDVDLLGSPLPVPTLDSAARPETRVVTLRAGRELRSGSLRVRVLWPSDAATKATGDPNLSSLVLLATSAGRRVLLTGDAEQEMTHLRPGPIDVLKVAHHGSADAGLGALLASSTPAIATVSAGAGNSYGHPADSTTAALAAASTCVLRTDRDGAITIDLHRGPLAAWSGGEAIAAARPDC